MLSGKISHYTFYNLQAPFVFKFKLPIESICNSNWPYLTENKVSTIQYVQFMKRTKENLVFEHVHLIQKRATKRQLFFSNFFLLFNEQIRHNSPVVATPPRELDLNKREFSLSESVYKQVSDFLGKCFFAKWIFKDVLYVKIVCKIKPPFHCAHTLPMSDHNLNKLDYLPPGDASIVYRFSG